MKCSTTGSGVIAASVLFRQRCSLNPSAKPRRRLKQRVSTIDSTPHRDAKPGSTEKVSLDEYERMRRELAKVKTERDILKKALGYFAAEPK